MPSEMSRLGQFGITCFHSHGLMRSMWFGMLLLLSQKFTWSLNFRANDYLTVSASKTTESIKTDSSHLRRNDYVTQVTSWIQYFIGIGRSFATY